MLATLIVANHFLETDLKKLRAAASMGYARAAVRPGATRSEGLV
jgi:hypothetical protein